VSQPHFAPITSGLLVRKGDASPSPLGGKPALFWAREDEEPLPPPPVVEHRTAATPPMPPDGGKPHKMMVTLTAVEFERLGIAAVKKNVTRHQIVRDALDLHMDKLKREYGGCGCMATGGSCSRDCGAA
jgi:hypothetical protein